MEILDAIKVSTPQDLSRACGLLSCVIAASHEQRLALGGQTIRLDHGGVFVLTWPDSVSLMRQLRELCALETPVIRYAGGALIADLSLQDNLMLEPALSNGQLPLELLFEMTELFSDADCALERVMWATTLGGQASAAELMQIRVGRALMSDPDVLLVDAGQWNDDLLAPQRFSQAFVVAYPWRTLVWACIQPARAAMLQQSLQELQA